MHAVRRLTTFAALVGSLAGPVARADVIRTFEAQGVFASGASLGGTIAIDTTLGTIAATDLTVSHLATRLFSAVDSSEPGSEGSVVLTVGKRQTGYPALVLQILTPTLVQYAGGPLASATDPSPAETASVLRRRRHHVDGTLVEARLTPLPEPDSAALLATSALLLPLCWGLRRPEARRPIRA